METANKYVISVISAEKVEQNEDLLNILLVRVPAKSLVRFKCVSKRWFSHISDSNFVNNHTRNNSNLIASGLYTDSHALVNFTTKSLNGLQSLPKLNFLSTTNQCEVTIYHSCNGLTLCSRGPELIVCNFTTQKLKVIPSFYPPFPRFPDGRFIAFNPTKSPHYKVVLFLICANDLDGSLLETVGIFSHSFYHVDIYSSKSRTWKRIVVGPETYRFTERVFCKGSIYWIDRGSKLEKFNIYEEKSKKIQLRSQPLIFSGEYPIVWFGEFDGRLFLVQAISSTEFDLRVLEMDMHTFNWNIKFIVDLEPTINTFLGELDLRNLQSVQVLCLKEGDDKENPILVLAIKGKIISYNPNGDRVEFIEGVFRDARETNKRVHKFIESLAMI